MKSLNNTLDELENARRSSDINRSIAIIKDSVALQDSSEIDKWFHVRYDFVCFLIDEGSQSPKYIEDAIEILNHLLNDMMENEKNLSWAMVNVSLGYAYDCRKDDDENENLENTIMYYKRALSIFTKKGNPRHWAAMKAGIGYKYAIKKSGNKMENFAIAVHHVRDSLEIYTKDQYPDDYWDKTRELARIKTIINDEKIWEKIWDEYENKSF